MEKRSLVIPVYRNAENIPSLVAALRNLHRDLGDPFEVVFVVDGSPDNSAELLRDSLPGLPFEAQLISHSRNFGAFTAIRTGMEFANGEYVAAMAADLQEPPELITEFFRLLVAGEADVVFGRREGRHDSWLNQLFSNAFWGIYRRYVLRDMPRGGVDIFACNRKVRDAVLSIEEANSSLVAQLFWVGFKRAFVPYVRRAREHGRSAWNFSKRFRYMMDSIFSFSDLPILAILWIGVFGCSVSILLGIATAIARLSGMIVEAGYATTVLLIVFFGSLSLAVQGILGSYLWRTVENTKHRPLRVLNGVLVHRPGAGGDKP